MVRRKMIDMGCYLSGDVSGGQSSRVSQGRLIGCRGGKVKELSLGSRKVAGSRVKDGEVFSESRGPTTRPRLVKRALISFRRLKYRAREYGGCWCLFWGWRMRIWITKAVDATLELRHKGRGMAGKRLAWELDDPHS